MAKKAAKSPPAAVTVTYDLFDLPTAQHKAGLAGLLLQVMSLQDRKKDTPVPRVVERTATRATIEFTEASVQALFDDVYAAEEVEVTVKQKWAGGDLVREDEVEEVVDGTPRKVRHFVYRQTQPSATFLRHFVPHKPWIKLWRDMLWAIPRGIPKTREPYEQRAAGKPCKEGASMWAHLLEVDAARRNNGFHTAPVVGSLLLGAQATNAELLPFKGRAEQNLLLHFWPLTSLVYVPQVVQPDGASEFVGYVLAVPEVADLNGFVAEYPNVLSQLGDQVRGYRPAEAVIDLPAQGALSFMEHLARLAGDKAMSSQTRYSISAVEYLHLAKFGNTIKAMASGRIAPRPNWLESYLDIVGRSGAKLRYKNPLFRRGLMVAFLEQQRWYRPFDKLLAEWPAEFFVRSEKSPKNLSWFWSDVRKKFQEVYQAVQADLNNAPEEDRLAVLIQRVVRRYLRSRLERQTQSKFDSQKPLPIKHADDLRKIAEGLFLEFRSRRDQAFAGHFAATFFAVTQIVKQKDLAFLAVQLRTNLDEVKTLTLMALSANSWIPTPQESRA